MLDSPLKVDLAIVARDLKLPPEKIEKTVELLDTGNTIPFITRFRKDLTGGLNEQQILAVKQRVAKLRALAERKAFVLKSIQSQGKLTDELKIQIDKVHSNRRLEDLYLPFKPKKQSRASLARQQGLEPLANEVFEATTPEADLATRAPEFVRVDKGLTSVDDVIKGVGDLLAERFSENDEVRSSLRKIMWTEGKLTTQSIPQPEPAAEKSSEPANEKPAVAETPSKPDSSDSNPGETVDKATPDATEPVPTPKADDSQSGQPKEGESDVIVKQSKLEKSSDESIPAVDAKPISEAKNSDEPKAAGVSVESSVEPSSSTVDASAGDQAAETSTESTDSIATGDKTSENGDMSAPASPTAGASDSSAAATATDKPKKKKKKKKKKKPAEDPFKDYHDFKQPIKKVPNHRILAINRGERSGKLKVKIFVEGDKLGQTARDALVPADHPFQEFLTKCANDAISRMVLPSLEREIRRELTESAEKHAVEVFANNLRNLLLQPPIRNRTVLAIDPGFKRGCSVAVLDPCGNLLDSGHVFVVGNQTRRDESKQKIVNWVKQHNADVIAIGNGAACRQTEQMVSDAIAESLQDCQTRYVMVNEAGASIYSTSEIGREELPDMAPSIRSAASIGRRLQDPLSELVKISPANIGVGMYQHDVKAKHLSESLDEVVQFCVNRVGVNVNTASPSLLKYVSGLNALTARRVVEHRQANGQFKNRNQLKEVSGFGDATFVQSAGFLRIHGGDSLLDCTSIHPESYDIANDVLQRVDVSIEKLFPKELASPTPVPAPPQQTAAPAAKDESEPEDKAATEPATTESVASAEQAPAGDSAATVEPASVPETSVDVPPVNTPDGDAAATVSATSELPAGAAKEPATGQVSDSRENAVARQEILKRFVDLDIEQLAQAHSAGKLLVKDILMALKRPQWDPRDKVNKPIFRRGIIKADDLKPEMQLDAQVVNVVDFGVFVDIGLGESSLVHVSQLSNHFTRDPHRLYSVGDVLKVWVSEVDTERRRVKLTAIRPGSHKSQSRRGRGQKQRDSSSGGARSGGGQGGTQHKPGKYGGGARTQGNSGRRGKFGKSTPYKHQPRRSKPKVVKPITEEMLEGKAPMRSFSDLAQFVNKKPAESKEKDKNSKDKNPKDSSS